MKKLFSKYIFFYRKLGGILFFKKIFTSISYRIKAKIFTYTLVRSNTSLKNKFTAIYQKTKAEDFESVSGEGSSLSYTSSLRKSLPIMFNQFEIKSIFDAPCGDFNWMRHVINGSEYTYVGADIVSKLIDSNNAQYANDHISFTQLDICKDPLVDADIMICRDCLFHLSYADIDDFIKNFIKSNIPLLLVTTHKNTDKYFKNRNIRSGDFRLFDLFSAPFNFPEKVLHRFDDYSDPEPAREMCLFSREQLISLDRQGMV